MKKVIIILIIILSLLLIGLGVFHLLNSVPKEKRVTPNNTTEKKVPLSSDYIEKESKNLLNLVDIFNKVLANDYPIGSVDKLSDYKKTAVLLEAIRVKTEKDEISLDEVTNESNKYFKTINIQKKDIISDDNKETTIYDYESSKYTYKKIPFHYLNIFMTNIKFVDLYESEITIESSPYFIESKTEEGSEVIKNAVYKDFDLKSKLYEFEGELKIDEELENQIKDKLDTYVYYFEKYNNEYILKSVTKKVE